MLIDLLMVYNACLARRLPMLPPLPLFATRFRYFRRLRHDTMAMPPR